MTKLQELVNNLGEVIIDYYVQQTKLKIDNPSDSRDFFEGLIAKATKSYPTRERFLNYLLYVIDTLKPLVDKDTPLSKEEVSSTTHLIKELVNNAQLLLTGYKGEFIEIIYAQNKVVMEGFRLRTFQSFWSPICFTGQIITEKLMKAFDFEKGAYYLDDTVKNIIDDHQKSFLPGQENHDLQQKLVLEKTKSAALQEELLLEQTKSATVQEELLLEQTKSAAVQEELRFRQLENETLKNTIQSLEKKNLSLSNKITEQAEQMGRLMEENSALAKSAKANSDTVRAPAGMGSLYGSIFPTARHLAARASTILYPGAVLDNIDESRP
ncbi:MAG: hypothetical protein Q8M03_13025 [Legionella sp.]|nr:hypothetical protein [Legionella sp.]